MASKDPTFETTGLMGVFLSNHTDWGGLDTLAKEPSLPSGLAVLPLQASLTYPSATPPPPWTKGTDWRILPGAQYNIAPNGFPKATSIGTYQTVGSSCVLSVSDRSAGKVALGAQYLFDQPFLAGAGTVVSMHFTVSGVAGGSTVLPGFGLFNLGSNPRAWTYIAPTAFDGTWSIQLRSDDFLDYATLGVTYVRYSTMPGGMALSRLIYSVSGNSRATYPFPLHSPHTAGNVAMPPPGPSQDTSRIDLVSRA